jgi:hypothetical protein
LGYLTIRLRDVPYRDDILFHVGNEPGETEGCLLVGKSKGKDRVYDSEKALNEILAIVNFAKTVDKALGQPTDIIIRIR